MAEENQEQPKQPNIRTMRSDVSEYLKETKPSLIQLITNEEPLAVAERELEPKKPRNLSFLWWGIGTLLLLIVAGYGAYLLTRTAPIQEAQLKVPQPLLSVERSSAVSVISGDTETPYEKSIERGDIADAEGDMTRIVAVIGSGTLDQRVLTPIEFLRASGVVLPAHTADLLGTNYMPFIYKTRFGNRQGIILEVKDRDRVFQALLSNENGMQENWATIFPGRNPPTHIIPFEDRTYRNISYRILSLAPEQDSVLVYGFFPAKNYLIVATSEEALRLIVNRLFLAS